MDWKALNKAKLLAFVTETDIINGETEDTVADMTRIITEMEKKQRQLWTARCILTVILVGFMLWAWPGYLAHDYYVSETHSGRYEPTDVLSGENTVTQYFVPQNTHLAKIQIAVLFDNESIEDEAIEFALYEESGKEIHSEVIPLKQMITGHYYDININKRVKTDRQYYWVLSAPESDRIDFQVMFTGHLADQAPDNTLFLLNDKPIHDTAQTVSQYVYLSHPDKIVIICVYWLSEILAYIVCLELADRFFGTKKSPLHSI